MTASIVILTGTGEHADPWHGLDATSARIADVLAPLGSSTILDVRDAPEGAADADLVIVNASSDLATPAPESSAIVSALGERVARGGAVIGVHSATLAFRDDPRWEKLLGGTWVPGVSGHPQIGQALVQVSPAVRAEFGIDDFVLYDERYTALRRADDTELLAWHTEDGITHPLVWRRVESRARIAYLALGHGVEAYDSDAGCRLLRRVASWALDGN